MSKKSKIIILFVISILFNISIQFSAFAATLDESSCKAQAKSKLNTSSVDNVISIARACKTIAGASNWQGSIWVSAQYSNNYGGMSIDRDTNISGDSSTTYLHGMLLFNGDGNYNLRRKHTYAIQISFHYCTNNADNDKACHNDIEIPVSSNPSHDPLSTYIYYQGNASANNKNIKLQHSNGSLDSINTGLTLERGAKNSSSYTSEGGLAPITFYPNNIITYLANKGVDTTNNSSFKIWIQRRGLLSSDDYLNDNGTYDYYAAGYDAETITIIKPNSTITAESQVKINSGNWKSSDSDSDDSGDDSTIWNVHFRHIIDIDGDKTTIDETNTRCPAGYTCNYSRGTSTINHNADSHIEKAELTYGESIKVCEFITIFKNSTEEATSSEACATLSKNHHTGTTTRPSTSSATVTYDSYCSSNESSNLIEIDKNTTSYTINFTQNPDFVNYLGPEGTVKSNIINDASSRASNALSSSSSKSTDNIQLGETQSLSHTFNPKKIKYSYDISAEETCSTYDGNIMESTCVPNYDSATSSLNGQTDIENNLACSDHSVYRQTEIIPNDGGGDPTWNNGVNINLSTISHWKVGGGTESINEWITATSTNAQIHNDTLDTKKIYAKSYDNDTIELDYTYGLNYSWLNGTFNSRRFNNNILPWYAYALPYQLRQFETTASENIGTDNKWDPDVTITNKTGDLSSEGETDLMIGRYNKQICRAATSYRSYLAHHSSIEPQGSPTDYSAEACAHLYRPWNYNLSFTSIESTSNKGMLYLNNQTTTVTAYLKNDSNSSYDPNQEGNPSYSPETTFTLYQVTISDNDFIDITDISDIQNLESKIENGEIPRERVGSPQTKTFEPKSEDNEVKFENVSFDQASVGDHICLFVIANRTNSKNDTAGNTHTYYDETHPHDRYSDLTCFTVAGFPTFQVRGGSILTEGSVKAKVVKSSDAYFGSWIDYGLATKGNIEQLSSGKAFVEKKYTYPNNHPLTIANDEQIGNEPKGQSKISASATKKRLKSLYAPGVKTALDNSKFTDNFTYDDEIDISKSASYTTYTSNQFTITTPTSDTNAKYRYTYINKPDNDTVIKQGSNLPKGVTHVIYSTGNIVIGSDFTYSSESYSQISDIPQYVIISEKNIYIDQYVKEVHAWLIADGEVNTCSGYTEKIDELGNPNNGLHQANGYGSASYYSGVCDTALSIYGPIFAKNIWLERTSISGVTGVSEMVNLTAENYYWALAKAKESNKISTAYIRSLAPRY